METREYKERTRVNITTSGIYPMYPMKAEYKKKGEYETFNMLFSVDFGSQLSCVINKTIFFKSREQFNKEASFLLKFICPDCLTEKSTATSFKGYMDFLCPKINAEIQRQISQKERTLVMGKVRMKKGNQYAEFTEYLTKDLKEMPYLAFPDDVKSLSWYTVWDLENCETPFAYSDPASVRSVIEATTVSTGWEAPVTQDDLPF